jgi:hypothetical protein
MISVISFGVLLPLLLIFYLNHLMSKDKKGVQNVSRFGNELSPDTTFADEGEFEDIPITCPQSLWMIDYQDFHGERTTRKITLEALRKKLGHYYLLAFCHERREQRSFRTDRTISATDLATGEVFDNARSLISHLTECQPPLSPLLGKQVAVNWPLSRMEYWEVRMKIEALGATLHGGRLTKEVDFVIAGDKSEQKKVERAHKLGVKVLSEDQWLQIIEDAKSGNNSDGRQML